jgi:cytochrome P450
MSSREMSLRLQTVDAAILLFLIAADVVLPGGSSAVICIQHVHMDPEHFSEPDKFKPERFVPDNRRHPFSYIPFSAGPRNCIGTFA